MKFDFVLVLFSILLSACAPSGLPTTASTITTAKTETSAPSSSPTPEPSATPSATITPSPSATLTDTPVPSDTPTATPIPTYIKLRGEVLVAHAVCHYGPGAPYLYKYSVVGGSNLEIIGRFEMSDYVQVQAIGGHNPCWVKASYMKINGDINNVAPIDPDNVGMPWSPYYGPIKGVSARRDGDTVTVFWTPVVLRAGDDSEQMPYLIEAWVCQGGKMVFAPTGSKGIAAKIVDEPGCSTPSHARIYAAEKHGYTKWIKVPWPAAGE